MSTRFLVLILVAVIGTTIAVAEEKPKPKLPHVARIAETVNLDKITVAGEFQAFMERHGFPLPPVPLHRFNSRLTSGRTILTALYRFPGAVASLRMFMDFKESLAVNDNLAPDPANRWTVYAVTSRGGARSAAGALLYHNPEAGYSLRYAFSAEIDRDLVTVSVLLQPCLQSPSN